MVNKVTKEQLEELVVKAEYHRLTQCLTVCVLTLKNGFELLGQSACVDPNNYDRTIGEQVAYQDAFEQLWKLEGYLLKNKLAGY